jgi:hypothetical protein
MCLANPYVSKPGLPELSFNPIGPISALVIRSVLKFMKLKDKKHMPFPQKTKQKQSLCHIAGRKSPLKQR